MEQGDNVEKCRSYVTTRQNKIPCVCVCIYITYIYTDKTEI